MKWISDLIQNFEVYSNKDSLLCNNDWEFWISDFLCPTKMKSAHAEKETHNAGKRRKKLFWHEHLSTKPDDIKWAWKIESPNAR